MDPVSDALPEPKQPAQCFFRGMKNLRFGVGFGALLFATNWLMSGHGTLPRWADVHPFPYGCGVIVSLIAGIILSRTKVARSIWWWILASVCGGLVIHFQLPITIWAGYVLIAYFASLWHVVAEDTVKFTTPFPTLAYVILTWELLGLASLWAVAYPFVPGGDFLREQSLTVRSTRISRETNTYRVLSDLRSYHASRPNWLFSPWCPTRFSCCPSCSVCPPTFFLRTLSNPH